MRNGISILVGAGILVCLILLRLWDPIPVTTVRESYFDTLQRLAPRQAAEVPVRVVDIDEQSLRRHGQWPWSRSKLAQLTDRLVDMGAAVIVFDFLFAEPDRLSPSTLALDPGFRDFLGSVEMADEFFALDSDAIFATALSQTAAVLGVSDAGFDGPAPLDPMGGLVGINGGSGDGLFYLPSTTGLVPVLGNAAAGTGIVNISPENADGVIREVPLLWRSDAGVHNSLSLEALRVAFGEESTLLFGDGSTGTLDMIAISDIEIPTTQSGQFRVYHRSDPSDLVISANSVLQGTENPDLSARIDGNIVFVGTSAAGLLDLHGTPLGTTVPGVVIHAQILEQILTGQFLERSNYSNGIEIIELAGLCLLMTALLSFFGPGTTLALGGLASGGLILNSWFGFTQNGLLVDVTFPLIGGFITLSSIAFLRYIFADNERRAIRRSFSKYVSGDVLAQIEKNRHNLELGGEMRDVTVMFCDIRDFTPLSETMSPQEMVTLLNDLFSELTDEILLQGGTIDKFIGDSIMAFWNAPIEQVDHHLGAQAAALGMRRRLRAFNQSRQAAGQPLIDISIGIASGMACVGNIGSRDRFDYSVIGETVNIAARVESASRDIGFDIVMLHSPERPTPNARLSAGTYLLKGISDAVQIEILVGDHSIAKSAQFHNIKQAHSGLLAGAQKGMADRDQLAKAKNLADALDPSLDVFYRRLEHHLDQGRKTIQ